MPGESFDTKTPLSISNSSDVRFLGRLGGVVKALGGDPASMADCGTTMPSISCLAWAGTFGTEGTSDE